MNSLTTITEELEEELPDDCPELVQKLMTELKKSQLRVLECEEQLNKVDLHDARLKELMVLCQSKNAEIFALERKVKDLTERSEEKDRQIISMLSMAKEFKQLVESEDKAVQASEVNTHIIEKKLIQSEEKNMKLKEMLVSQIEEIQKLKSHETDSRDSSYTSVSKKKPEPKVKPGGYYPLFLRKPREGYIGNM